MGYVERDGGTGAEVVVTHRGRLNHAAVDAPLQLRVRGLCGEGCEEEDERPPKQTNSAITHRGPLGWNVKNTATRPRPLGRAGSTGCLVRKRSGRTKRLD